MGMLELSDGAAVAVTVFLENCLCLGPGHHDRVVCGLGMNFLLCRILGGKGLVLKQQLGGPSLAVRAASTGVGAHAERLMANCMWCLDTAQRVSFCSH